jgi:hypothetical protein
MWKSGWGVGTRLNLSDHHLCIHMSLEDHEQINAHVHEVIRELTELTIEQAAQHLGVSEITIRRRIRNGDIHAHQQPRPQGFTWVVVLPDEEIETPTPPGHDESADARSRVEENLQDIIRRQDETIDLLRHQLETREREVQELHVLLQQAQAALPAPRENGRSWWRFWQR